MGVEQIGEIYKCNIYVNEVVVIKVGIGTLVRCDQDMARIERKPPEAINIPDAGG